jgi:Ca-activated chloride channel family protein
MNKAETETKVYTEFEEQFPVLIWVALGLLVLDFVLLERKNKWLKEIRLFEKLN